MEKQFDLLLKANDTNVFTAKVNLMIKIIINWYSFLSYALDSNGNVLPVLIIYSSLIVTWVDNAFLGFRAYVLWVEWN